MQGWSNASTTCIAFLSDTEGKGACSFADRNLFLHCHDQAELKDFELWRWFFFFGGLAPIWWFGDFVVRLLVFLVESAFLNTKNVMYFLVAIRVSHPAQLPA